MIITKVLEVLGKEIIRLEDDNKYKDYEISNLKEKLKEVEEYIGGIYEKNK